MAREEEQKWSVKVIRHLSDDLFKITWASGEETIESLEFLDTIDHRAIERAKEIAPYPVVLSCRFVKKDSPNSFKAWISQERTISKLLPTQFPLFEGELSRISHYNKTALVGKTFTENLEGAPLSDVSFNPVSGGCFQKSLSIFLKAHGISEIPLRRKLGESTYVDLRQVQEMSEREDWPFRLLKVQKKSEASNGSFLKITDDHCDYVNSFDRSQCSGIWELRIVKGTRKRLRNWK
jgi:hypothetical protein